MESNKSYFAFISYKREDEKYAEELRRKLEHYRLPSKLRKADSSLPKEIRPVFRDALELAGGVLSKEIESALQQSKYLIVICSPNSAKSPWVNKEVQTFINYGREEQIIPFIIDGIPYSGEEASECFPPALRSLKEDRELLGININEINRDAASLKVIAYMLGLKFDTLWQRYEREQRLKRWIWTGLSVILAILGFGISSYFIKQNQLIESQNDQLQNLVNNLKEENNTISFLQSDQKQYNFMGQLRGSGCYDISLMEFNYHPYEPIVAFIDDSGIWLHYLNSDREVCLPTYYKGEQILDLCDLRFSNDGCLLKANGHTTSNWDYADFVWSVEDCKLIGPCSLDIFDEIISENKHLLETMNYECRDGKLYLYNTVEHKTICSTDFDSDDKKPNSVYNPKYEEILFLSEKRAALYDNAKGEFVMFFKGYNDPDQFEFSESGEYMRIGKNIYGRTIKIDTIGNLKYSICPIADYPYIKENSAYDTISHASLDVNEESIVYKSGNVIKRKKVVSDYTSGNMQEHLVDALFAGSNKVIAIVEQGRFRIYNSKTWSLIGTLPNYIWAGIDGSMGHEEELGHASSFIAMAKYFNNKLYVLSSGGVLRIYDVNKYRLEHVIELPMEKRGEDFSGVPIDKASLINNASLIIYSYEGQPFYYKCELPKIVY